MDDPLSPEGPRFTTIPKTTIRKPILPQDSKYSLFI